MAYFEFKNGETPLNDTNLNLMQDDIKKDIEKISNSTSILYDNESGSFGTITLNTNKSDYDYLKIIYGNNGKTLFEVKEILASSNTVNLTRESVSSNTCYVRKTAYTIEENKLIPNVVTNYRYTYEGAFTNEGGDNQIYIYKVIGVKEVINE